MWGFSFSWKRALGITSAKQKFARFTGIPTSKTGIDRKVGNSVLGSAFNAVAAGTLVATNKSSDRKIEKRTANRLISDDEREQIEKERNSQRRSKECRSLLKWFAFILLAIVGMFHMILSGSSDKKRRKKSSSSSFF